MDFKKSNRKIMFIATVLIFLGIILVINPAQGYLSGDYVGYDWATPTAINVSIPNVVEIHFIGAEGHYHGSDARYWYPYWCWTNQTGLTYSMTMGGTGETQCGVDPRLRGVGAFPYDVNTAGKANYQFVDLGESYQDTAPFTMTRHVRWIIGNATGGNTTGIFSLIVSPENINYGDTFNMYINSTAGYYGINEVRYGYTKDTGKQDILFDGNNPSYLMDYALITGIWYQYDTNTNTFSINKGASIPNPVFTIGDARGNIQVGNYTIDCYLIKNDNSVQKITDILNILQGGNQELVIEAKDYLTGDLISGTHINVLDVSKNIWINQTTSYGTATLFYPYGTHIYIEATKSGYSNAYKNWTITSVPYYRLWMIMYRGETPPVSNTTLFVSVFDGSNFAPLTGASIIVTDETNFSGEEQQKYTGESGVATFNLSINKTYTIRASKTGYLNGGDIIDTTGLGGTSIEISILLQRISAVTPIPTATISSIPTVTQIGGNITPSAECKTIMPVGSTLLDTLFNNMACAGIRSGTNQGYGIALMIIFTLGVIGGKYGKGLGVMLGIGGGYVLSLAMGLVPLWTFIAILVIFGIIFAGKIFGSN